jgi:hypothetical protein
MGAYDDGGKGIATSFVKILRAAGIAFGTLGTEEKCCGDAARRLGNEYLFQSLARKYRSFQAIRGPEDRHHLPPRLQHAQARVPQAPRSCPRLDRRGQGEAAGDRSRLPRRAHPLPHRAGNDRAEARGRRTLYFPRSVLFGAAQWPDQRTAGPPLRPSAPSRKSSAGTATTASAAARAEA